jgi:2-methylcitrate dehydratase
LNDGRKLYREKKGYEGFHDHPASWETVAAKFNNLAAPYSSAGLRQRIIDVVQCLEDYPVADLMEALSQVKTPSFISQ